VWGQQVLFDVIFTVARVKVHNYKKHNHKSQEMFVSSCSVSTTETTSIAQLNFSDREPGQIIHSNLGWKGYSLIDITKAL
jgi:predicted DNA binding protein